MPLTKGTDFLLLPTPTASPSGSNKGGAATRVGKERPSLETMAKRGTLPTPRASDANGGPCYHQPPSREGGFGLKELAPGSPVCGMAHGVPNRSHRLKSLGNAVVPQVIEFFGQSIKEFEKNEF